MRLRAGIGIGTEERAFEAGREAASQAVASLGQEPALVIVFTAPKYALDDLLAGIRSVTGQARLLGATASGEMTLGRYMGFGGGVAVLAVTAGPYRFGLASAARIRGALDQAGQEIARRSRTEAGPSPHGAVLLFADSLLGDLQQLVQGVYRVTGPRIAIAGGAAGDEQKFQGTFVFHDDQIVEEGAAALWIASDHPLPVATRHGWSPLGAPLLVTRAEGTLIMELGGRPAAEVYEEQLGLTPGRLRPEEFWGVSILHPFGLLQSDGSAVIRVARETTPEGWLRIQGCVPPAGSAVQVMSGSAHTLLDVVGDVVGEATRDRAEPGVLLAFSCAARATIFGDRAAEESRRLQEAAGATPTFGVYCCGEFARTQGVLGTHNATLTALAL